MKAAAGGLLDHVGKVNKPEESTGKILRRVGWSRVTFKSSVTPRCAICRVARAGPIFAALWVTKSAGYE